MTDATCVTNCNACTCCCNERLKRLERRVCWIRTGLLIALGVLLLLIGIGIGKGGERRAEARQRVAGFVQRRAMMGGMGGPGGPAMGPGPMARMGPGGNGDRGPEGRADEREDDAPRRRDGRKGN